VIDANNTPFALLGGEAPARALAKRFYELMYEREPALTRVHRCDADGRVAPEMQERFALFLIGWLGGPQTYMQTHGHPRLRMRHGHVAINVAMRDAWLRTMSAAMDDQGVTGELRGFLDARFGEVADFLRNAG
jgi:hemoglobin